MASGHGPTSPSYMRRGRHGAGSRQGGGLAAMVLEEMCETAWSKWRRRLTVNRILPPSTRILPQQLYYYYYKLFLPELTWKELSWQKIQPEKISFLCRWFCIIDLQWQSSVEKKRMKKEEIYQPLFDEKKNHPSRYLTKKSPSASVVS